ncbi:MAG TPA: mechanosensitive ion channel family protein, partial [Verrucomicrobiota bacterium]|nr:mechanosensitive ion channel family protein [Verrucomicrobiota bacterium]
MQIKLEKLYRGFLILLFVVLVWSVWSSTAQESASTSPAADQAQLEAATADGASATNAPHRKLMQTPGWVEDLADKYPVLKKEWWGNELWKYLFSLIYIFLAFYISKFLDYLTRVWLKKLTAKTKAKFDDMLLDLLNGPVKVVAFVIFLRIGLDVFEWPDIVQAVLAKGFTVIVAISLTYMVLKFIDLAMGYWRERASAQEDDAFNKQLFPVIRKSLKAFVVVVATLTTLNNMGVNITAAIASLSIGGLAVGLAAQDTLANLFGAVSIFLDKPFKIGDRIQMDGVDGSVETIGLRSTRVRNLDGHLVTIPNKAMGNATITNIAARPNIRTLMNIGITYDTPVEKVKLALKIVEETFRGHPNTHDLITSFNKFESSSLNIFVVHWWNNTDFRACLAGLQEMNLKLKERFDAEKISFAFPTQTLYVKQD